MKKNVIRIETPCDVKQIELAVNTICHAGGCLDSEVKIEGNTIVFTYEEHH